ncbi:hypothetical protein [Psychroserpens ponticola]|uniref:Lipoprotein n=1 Tax=Psychroserpens ponticola TaxID=2932268 RepID=A0ABY7RXP9_9FLAO|nr:hypothetical protein [Psychroserpens ponticola]WCO01648.1 hypothetical protein MUN68_016495 [Psychroserpens ponticola]
MLFSFFILFSCTDIVTHHLNQGLEELEFSFDINQILIDDIKVESVGFFKLNDSIYKIAIKFNDEAINEDLNKYTLGMHIKPKDSDKHLLQKNKNYISWDFIPKLESYNNHKYVIRTLNSKVKHIKSLRIFLYNQGVYKERYGNNIILNNITLY